MKRRKELFSAMFVVVLVLGSWIGARAQGEITLLAAGPTRRAADKIVANFQTKTGYKVKAIYVNGVETRQVVAKGQPQDVNLIIGPFPAAVASRTLDISSATPVTSVVWVLAVPKGRPKPDISTPAAVKKALLDAKSIGYEDPDFTVAGQGPWEALTNLGIADQVATKSKIELGPASQGIDPSVTDAVVKTITRLENGSIDIALHQYNDLIADQDKYQVVGVLPREVAKPTPIVGFLSTRAKDNAGAKALLQYLASPEAQAIWKEGGLGAPEKWPVIN
jgi:molybdate transport system substrate-binding protein